VRAPFAGMLTWLLADEGASVSTGQLVAKVSELNNYKVEASLSDFHARALSAGQPVLVEQGNVRLKGEVQTVLPEIQNGTVKLLVTLAEPHHSILRNKLRVEVNIITEQKQNTLLADNGPAFNGAARRIFSWCATASPARPRSTSAPAMARPSKSCPAPAPATSSSSRIPAATRTATASAWRNKENT
jgi:pyruvate/2-oxoglutarate dehydrogenase complex dihydrolipoamide acyltransferase (E2) component